MQRSMAGDRHEWRASGRGVSEVQRCIRRGQVSLQQQRQQHHHDTSASTQYLEFYGIQQDVLGWFEEKQLQRKVVAQRIELGLLDECRHLPADRSTTTTQTSNVSIIDRSAW
jgi:hypothetical protein